MPVELPPHAMPGSVIGGKYRLDEVIGRGGMGVVLAATHLSLGKRVAVKLLLSEASDKVRERFQLEAHAAAMIASVHIAQVLDFGITSDGLTFLVMEYLQGNDLQVERKRRQRLPAPEAVHIMLEASVGVAHAHARGLVHRDLKPANLFLAVQGARRVVKVLDFGLIKVLADQTSLTASTETFGTPKYMAPEQLRSARKVDERADQHALAMVLFELLAGHAPFQGEMIPEVIVKIVIEPAPMLRDVGILVPDGLDQAIHRALAKKPEDRFPTLSEFAQALAPFGDAGCQDIANEVTACLAARQPIVSGMFDDFRRTTKYARPSESVTGPKLAYEARAAGLTHDQPEVDGTAAGPPIFEYDGPSGSAHDANDTQLGTLSSGSLSGARAAAFGKSSSASLYAGAAFVAFSAALGIFAVYRTWGGGARDAKAIPSEVAAPPKKMATMEAKPAAPAALSTAHPVEVTPSIEDLPSASATEPGDLPTAESAVASAVAAPPATVHKPPMAPPIGVQRPPIRKKCTSLDCL